MLRTILLSNPPHQHTNHNRFYFNTLKTRGHGLCVLIINSIFITLFNNYFVILFYYFNNL